MNDGLAVSSYETDYKNGDSMPLHPAYSVEPPSTDSREVSFLQSLRDMQNLLGMTPAGALQRIKIGTDAYTELDRRVLRSRSISSQRRLADEEFSRRLCGLQDNQGPDGYENAHCARSSIARLPRFVVKPRQDGAFRMNWDGGNNGNEMDGPQPRQSKRMRVESGPCDQPALSRPKITFDSYLDKPSNQLLDDLQYSGRLPMPNEQRNHSSSPQPGVDPALRVRWIARKRDQFGPDNQNFQLQTGDRPTTRKPISDGAFAPPIDTTDSSPSHLYSGDPKEQQPDRTPALLQRSISRRLHRPAMQLPQPPEAVDTVGTPVVQSPITHETPLSFPANGSVQQRAQQETLATKDAPRQSAYIDPNANRNTSVLKKVRLAILMHPSATPNKAMQSCSCVRLARKSLTDSDEERDSPSSTPLSVDCSLDLTSTSRSSTFASDFSDEEATRIESLLTDRESDDPNTSRSYMDPKPLTEGEKENDRLLEIAKGKSMEDEEEEEKEEDEDSPPTMTPLAILRMAHIRSPGDEEDDEDASEGSCESLKSPLKTTLEALPAGDEAPERIGLKQACQRQITRAAYETITRQLSDFGTLPVADKQVAFTQLNVRRARFIFGSQYLDSQKATVKTLPSLLGCTEDESEEDSPKSCSDEQDELEEECYVRLCDSREYKREYTVVIPPCSDFLASLSMTPMTNEASLRVFTHNLAAPECQKAPKGGPQPEVPIAHTETPQPQPSSSLDDVSIDSPLEDQAVAAVLEGYDHASFLPHGNLPPSKWDDLVRQVWETAVAALRGPSVSANFASKHSPPPEHTAGACSHFLALSQSLLRRNLVHHLEDLQEAVAQKRLAHGLIPQVLRQIAEPSSVEEALRFTQTRSSSPPRLVTSAALKMVNQCNAVITVEMEPEECHLNSTNTDVGSAVASHSCLPESNQQRQQPR